MLNLALALYIAYIYFDIENNTKPLINYTPKLTTQIYDTNNLLIANLFKDEHRLYVKYDKIPAKLIEALLAIEDTSFFEHPGINIDGIFRALIKNIKAGAKVEGASTLTQQLVRSALKLTREKKISRKIKEAILSLKLENELSKEQILERYANHIYLGHGYYGFRTASLGYFRKELDELSLKEIAMLVALPRSPNYYNPTKNLNFSLSRANNVLLRMKNLGWCEENEFKNSVNEIPVIYNDTLTKNRAPYVVDAVIKKVSNNIDNFKSGGYKVTLSIDLELQELAHEALMYSYKMIKARDELEEFSSMLNGAMVVTESNSGAILAMVGGIDYKTSSFNRATMASRQIGSSVKPFIYLGAIDLGYHPLTQIPDISRTYKVDNKAEDDKLLNTSQEVKQKYWRPKNYEKNFKGFLSLEEALIHSRNLATINLVTEIGLSSVHKNLTNLGFKDVPQDLSISLGSFSATPLQMSRYYSLFSNYGTIVEPILIKNIENFNGKVYHFDTIKTPITSAEQAYLIVDIMKKTVQRGTGRGARVRGIELAGKTGTTNGNKDGWFCGFTPSIQIITWFGNDDNSPMNKRETGGRVGAPAFKYFVSHLLKNNPQIKRQFDIPPKVGVSRMQGKDVYFTHKSKIPQSSDTSISEDDEFNF